MGASSQRIELAPRSDGQRYRRVTLAADCRGGITLKVHETGASTGAAWGLDDDERELAVPAEHAARLALVLAAELLKGDPHALDRLSELCWEADIDFRIDRWT